jgi:hypothetical protein
MVPILFGLLRVDGGAACGDNLPEARDISFTVISALAREGLK